MILLNDFSPGMILAEFPASVTFAEISADEASIRLLSGADEAGVIDSAVDHPDTAAVFSRLLGVPVQYVGRPVTLNAGDQAILGQYMGPQPHGRVTGPYDRATIRWLLVTAASLGSGE